MRNAQHYTVLSLQAMFRLADPRHLQLGIHHPRNWPVIHVTVSRAYTLCRGDALFLCIVGEHRAKLDVTDVLDIWHAGVELVIDYDALARIDLDSTCFRD